MITIRELIIHLLDEYDDLDTAVAVGIWGTDDVIEACTWVGSLAITAAEARQVLAHIHIDPSTGLDWESVVEVAVGQVVVPHQEALCNVVPMEKWEAMMLARFEGQYEQWARRGYPHELNRIGYRSKADSYTAWCWDNCLPIVAYQVAKEIAAWAGREGNSLVPLEGWKTAVARLLDEEKPVYELVDTYARLFGQPETSEYEDACRRCIQQTREAAIILWDMGYD